MNRTTKLASIAAAAVLLLPFSRTLIAVYQLKQKFVFSTHRQLRVR